MLTLPKVFLTLCISSITRELPGNVPFDTKVSLIASFQKEWPDVKDLCFEEVRGYMLDVLRECIAEKFERYSYLQSRVR